MNSATLRPDSPPAAAPTPPSRGGRALLLGCALLAGACSGSGGGGGSSPTTPNPAGGFQLLGISVRNNEVWQINRSIEFAFSESVSFTSVGTDTISIKTPSGIPATGSFSQKLIDTDGDGMVDSVDERVVVWQPACPIRSDLSDAGLRPGGVLYQLQVSGSDTAPTNPLLAKSGRKLDVTQFRVFRTPNSTSDSVIFEDPVIGDPVPLVRRVSGGGSTPVMENVSYVEIGGNGDPSSRIFFERNNSNAANTVFPAGSVVPLNLYSDPDTSIAVVLEFNQPVSPRAKNLANSRLRLEYLLDEMTDTWTPIETRVTLVANCTGGGARVRLEPVGILPAGSMVRAVVLSGFEGIVGGIDSTSSDQNLFGRVPTEAVTFPSLNNPEDQADEYFEDFDVGGTAMGSFQDTDVLLEVPEASWGGGSLTARFDFEGDGGPGGDFDWFVRNDPESFDTSSQTIVGGPGGTQGAEQFTEGGIVNVRDFVVLPGAELRVQGPNPLVINATGEVRIEGRIVLSGFSAKDVATLNTGSQPEKGGTGAAGGGDGGNASEVRNNSTPRGGTGFGPFGELGTGGQGGETGYASGGAGDQFKDRRRPGGGGGGRFAQDQDDSTARTQQNSGNISQGMTAGKGGDGNPASTGAVTGLQPARGGDPGPGAFGDGNDENDFWGIKPDVDVTIPVSGAPPVAGPLMGLIRGELSGLHAGYGGGGGGDAVPFNQFPAPNWTVSSDEKGGGGGGAGGALHIRALGPIRFIGDNSRIACRGGQGGVGENTIFLDRIAGTGGTGSGGHLVLESASRIEFELGTQARRLFLDTRGGAGKTGPADDGNGTQIPTNVSFGGEGGPGIIQLHVPDPITPPQEDPSVTSIVLPAGTLADVDAGDANILNEVMRPAGIQMIPNFGAVSKTRSRWIDLGGADFNATGGSADLVRFLFGGIDTTTGRVLTDGNGRVMEQSPLLGPTPLSATAAIQSDGLTLLLSGAQLDPLVNSAAPISEDLYLRTPALLRNFTLRIAGTGGSPLDFSIQSAAYDAAAGTLSLTVAPQGISTLASYAAAATPPVSFSVIPRFFRVVTGGVPDALPDTAAITITFEGAEASNGLPVTNPLLVPETADVGELFNVLPGQLRFFRINYEFDLNAMGQGLSLSTPEVKLDFFRLPFVF